MYLLLDIVDHSSHIIKLDLNLTKELQKPLNAPVALVCVREQPIRSVIQHNKPFRGHGATRGSCVAGAGAGLVLCAAKVNSAKSRAPYLMAKNKEGQSFRNRTRNSDVGGQCYAT